MKRALLILSILTILVLGCTPPMVHYHGLKPVYPYGKQDLAQHVDTIQPEFKWEPAVEDGITYDFAIWKAPEKRVAGENSWGELVYYRLNLRDTIHRIETPLEYNTYYHWSVRKRRDNNVSSWSVFDSTLVSMMGTFYLKNSAFRFKTPKK